MCPTISARVDNPGKGARLHGFFTDLDGDQAYLTWQGEGDASRVPGTFSYTGGAGKYKGISGNNNFVAGPAVLRKDGAASGFAT